jgi:hypothetical protein
VIEVDDGGVIAVGTGGAVVRVDAALEKVRLEVRPDRQNLAAVAALPTGVAFFGQQGIVAASAASQQGGER